MILFYVGLNVFSISYLAMNLLVGGGQKNEGHDLTVVKCLGMELWLLLSARQDMESCRKQFSGVSIRIVRLG